MTGTEAIAVLQRRRDLLFKNLNELRSKKKETGLGRLRKEIRALEFFINGEEGRAVQNFRDIIDNLREQLAEQLAEQTERARTQTAEAFAARQKLRELGVEL